LARKRDVQVSAQPVWKLQNHAGFRLDVSEGPPATAISRAQFRGTLRSRTCQQQLPRS